LPAFARIDDPDAALAFAAGLAEAPVSLRA
jgi:hypothetical protein